MKICPTCQTAYDDEEMLFCIKDGTALKELPAQNQPNPAARDRFTVSLEQPPPAPTIQPTPAPQPQAKPAKQKSNAVLFAILAALLLLAGAALGAAAYFLLPAKTEIAKTNQNAANANSTNINSTSINDIAPPNLNANSTANQNLNLNLNANAKPSPKPSPLPSPSPANRNTNANSNANANQNNAQTNQNSINAPAVVTASPSPVAAPSPQVARPTTVSGGVLNGKATSLPRPAYPPNARQIRASGAVNVQVTIDESGSVIAANATSGNPLLRPAAVAAARQARFTPTILSGQPVKVSGVIVYNFVLD